MFLPKRMIAFILMVMMLLSLSAGAQGFRPYQKAGGYQYFTFGEYPQTASAEKSPIIWRVLEVKEGLVYALSDAILDVRRIDGQQWEYKGWLHSELHDWLNEQMLLQAFSEDERRALHQDAELGFLSLPSVDDIRNPAFGFAGDKDRLFVGTEYALAQGLYRYSSRSYSPIWTRTASQKKHAHRSTKSGGGLGFIGVESDDLGLMPVIWLKEDEVIITSGEGTLGSPYVLGSSEASQ
ncbi:MAG: hypothetical protein GX781_06205 [Clostridiales bacterium]|nr:hypothetical protein [Clostridiales bacterium]